MIKREYNLGFPYEVTLTIFVDRDANFLEVEGNNCQVIGELVQDALYDIDDTIITKPILNEGDASFTLFGGHTYETLENDTIVYEYKTGPYEGQKLDKEFLDD